MRWNKYLKYLLLSANRFVCFPPSSFPTLWVLRFFLLPSPLFLWPAPSGTFCARIDCVYSNNNSMGRRGKRPEEGRGGGGYRQKQPSPLGREMPLSEEEEKSPWSGEGEGRRERVWGCRTTIGEGRRGLRALRTDRPDPPPARPQCKSQSKATNTQPGEGGGKRKWPGKRGEEGGGGGYDRQ